MVLWGVRSDIAVFRYQAREWWVSSGEAFSEEGATNWKPAEVTKLWGIFRRGMRKSPCALEGRRPAVGCENKSEPDNRYSNFSTYQTIAIVSTLELPRHPYLPKRFSCHFHRPIVPTCVRKLCGTRLRTRMLEKWASITWRRLWTQYKLLTSIWSAFKPTSHNHQVVIVLSHKSISVLLVQSIRVSLLIRRFPPLIHGVVTVPTWVCCNCATYSLWLNLFRPPVH